MTDAGSRRLPKRKSLGQRKGRAGKKDTHAARDARMRAKTMETRAKRDVCYKAHADKLTLAVASKTTYTLLVGYDKSLSPEEQFTEGQLDYCELQCRTLFAYFQIAILHNNGEPDAWTLRDCAKYASLLSCGGANFKTVQSWLNHNFIPNDGFLMPRLTGKYARSPFVDWFVEQDDLLALYTTSLKNNIKQMSFKRAMQILNVVLQQEFKSDESSDTGSKWCFLTINFFVSASINIIETQPTFSSITKHVFKPHAIVFYES